MMIGIWLSAANGLIDKASEEFSSPVAKNTACELPPTTFAISIDVSVRDFPATRTILYPKPFNLFSTVAEMAPVPPSK